MVSSRWGSFLEEFPSVFAPAAGTPPPAATSTAAMCFSWSWGWKLETRMPRSVPGGNSSRLLAVSLLGEQSPDATSFSYEDTHATLCRTLMT